MSEWKPVDSVPEYTSVIAGLFMEYESFGPTLVWCQLSQWTDYGGEDDRPYAWDEWNEEDIGAQPTHWMPLPEPPMSVKEEA